MCGICGFIAPAAGPEQKASWLKEMTGLMAHRGPDDRGYFADHAVGLGYRRLAVIDRASGRQPMYNEDESLVLVYNGELYNLPELRRALEQAGHRFRTSCDSEAILHLYEEYGEDAPLHMRGMFAFAIWDRVARKLFLARDRLGIKPLYYTLYGGQPRFASEIKALLPGLPGQVNDLALSRYLSFRFVPGPQTMFAHVLKLLPGHSLTYHYAGGMSRMRRYWRLEDTSVPAGMDGEEYAGTLLNLLRECVASHLVSEVPVGCFLSGGLDSGAIVAAAAGLSDRPLTTFATGFASRMKGADCNYGEFAEAAEVARHFGTDHHEVRIPVDGITGVLPRLAWHLDEPLGDPTAIPLFFLAREARRRVTVALLGEGADELFAGYDLYRASRPADYFQTLPGALRRRILAPLGQMWPDGVRGKNFLDRVTGPVGESYFCAGQLFDDREKLLLLDPDLAGRLDLSDARRLTGELAGRVARLSSLDQMLYLDIMLWLPDDVLLKVDKVGMAHALELRVPYLDHRLVEFAFACPPGFKIKADVNKYVLRQAAARLMPERFANRRKIGFPVPITDLMAGPFYRYAAGLLTGRRALERGYYSRRGLDLLLSRAATGRRSFGRQVFALVMLELWHQAFIDRSLEMPQSARELREA
ncbi:MAG: asparagine synthase (glutamine-hydrolyzing) [Peptococcaceae bacterium]|jgi:asparagine synthase (glutamine-hydrolysing)|nr:asparagine synthase (glutamine-hydrolyzing) [Peptococcaceae bacterium]